MRWTGKSCPRLATSQPNQAKKKKSASFLAVNWELLKNSKQDHLCAEQRLHLVPRYSSTKELMPELQKAYYESVKCHNSFAVCETLYFLFLLKHHYASVGIAELKVMEWDQHHCSFQLAPLFPSEKLIRVCVCVLIQDFFKYITFYIWRYVLIADGLAILCLGLK